MEQGLLDRARLRLGLVHHHQVHVPLGQALVREGLCREADVLQALSVQLDVRSIDLDREPLNRKLVRLIPKRVARQYRVVPLRLEKGERDALHIALPAPASVEALDMVRAVSGKRRLEPWLASDSALSRALALLYGIEERPPASLVRPEAESGRSPPILLYGWPPVTATLIERAFTRYGIQTRRVSPLEVMHTVSSDLVFAPVQTMEGLLAGEAHIAGQLLLAGSSEQEDLDRAHQMGARGYVSNPLDGEMLLRAVRRLRLTATEETQGLW